MSDTKCIKCGQLVGNTVFTMCDNCWDKNPMTTPTPKQRLIEAVKEYRTLAKEDLASAKDEYDKLGAETCIFDCQHFLILIEENLPNE